MTLVPCDLKRCYPVFVWLGHIHTIIRHQEFDDLDLSFFTRDIERRPFLFFPSVKIDSIIVEQEFYNSQVAFNPSDSKRRLIFSVCLIDTHIRLFE